MNTTQREMLQYYRTLEEPDDNGHYTLDFALTVRRIYDALEYCWIYDVLDSN